MSKSLRFLALVQRAVMERGRRGSYLRAALKAARHIPNNVPAEDACAIFLSWYYEESEELSRRWMSRMPDRTLAGQTGLLS